MNAPMLAGSPAAVTGQEWRRVGLAIGLGLLLLGGLFNPEVTAAVRTWETSTAYNHCFLVIPIALYLLWDRRFDLVGIAPRPTPLLKQAFHFIPGMEMRFSVTGLDGVKEEHWAVETNATNYSYLVCKRTGAKAYFTNNGTLFYFNSFTGDKQTLLYRFYLGAHKVLLSYFPGVTIPDSLSREEIPAGFYKIAQDFLAPFVLFREPSYKATFSSADNHQVPSFIRLSSETQHVGRGGKCSFEIDITENTIKKITVNSDSLCITAENT